MKQINFFKKALLVSVLCATGAANAQVHPLSFSNLYGATQYYNYYANYVGMRVEVTTPASIAGNKAYTVANDGSGATGEWGGTLNAPIVNVPIFMDTTSDSFGCTAFSPAAAASMAGKIAVIWRGPIASGCQFVCKAANAAAAGAIAVVLINEYPGQGPVGMGTGTTCTPPTTVPIFMIGNLDGIAISAQYRAGIPVNMTLTPWGQNNQNDLGFVPEGVAGWHDYAIPENQLVANGSPTAYMGLDGAFIANFGTHNARHVKVATNITFTPNGGSPSQIHTDTTGILDTFKSIDSIYSFFAPNKYNLPSATGKGQYTMTYNIIQDSIDQFPADNALSYSFYSTDSTYSKGTYDFTATPPQPQRNIYYGGPNEFLWGPMYYVANGGYSLSTVQYSIEAAFNATTGVTDPLSGQNSILLFKWVDGYLDSNTSTQFPLDGIVENGELQLIALGVKSYSDPSDTSGGLMTCSTMGDTLTGNPPYFPVLDANSWYYIAVDVPATTSAPEYMGCDGVLSPYPRIYGMFNYNNNDTALDYSGAFINGTRDSVTYYAPYGNYPCPGAFTYNINSVDSFNYNGTKGLIPAVAMIVKPTPVGVKNVAKPFANVSIFPNPATDYLNVSISLEKPAKAVTYEIIDGLAKFVSKEVHSNVTNEVAKINTSKLAPGNYYLIITADTKIMSKKFTVIK